MIGSCAPATALPRVSSRLLGFGHAVSRSRAARGAAVSQDRALPTAEATVQRPMPRPSILAKRTQPGVSLTNNNGCLTFHKATPPGETMDFSRRAPLRKREIPVSSPAQASYRSSPCPSPRTWRAKGAVPGPKHDQQHIHDHFTRTPAYRRSPYSQ